MDKQQSKSATFIFISLSVQSIIHGQFFSSIPGVYQPASGKHCKSSYHCHEDSEELMARGDTCYWLYDGCGLGNCMCDPLTHVRETSSGRCKPIRRLNEACDSSDTCMNDLICENGTCRCPYPFRSAFSLCLRPTIKMLGQDCTPYTDTCYHEPVYGGHTDSEVECDRSTNSCQCKAGYIREKTTCRKLYIGEYGCVKDFYCEGGAVCVDGRCACPTSYKPVAHNTKCAKIGAFTELPLGKKCDEIQEKGYCAHGLICHRCHANDRDLTCVKYLPGLEAVRAALTNHARTVYTSFLSLLTSLIATILSRCFHNSFVLYDCR